MDDLPAARRLPRGVRRALLVEERLRRDVRRRRFVVRTLAEAARVGSGLDLRVHPGSTVGRNVAVEVWADTRNRLVVADGVRLGDGVLLSLRGGELTIGADTDVRRLVTVTCTGRLTVGAGVVLSTGTHVHCARDVEIGDWTIIGEHSTIADSNHVRTPGDAPVHHAVEAGRVRIGRNVWVGAKATITRDVRVGDQAFVAAHAVVTADVPDGWLAAGAPARAVRQIDGVTGS